MIRRAKLFIVLVFVGLASVGIPSQVAAEPGIPKSLSASIRVAGSVAPGRSVIVPVTLPWRANMIGLSFVSPDRRGSAVAIQVRAHDDKGWSAWQEDGVDDIGPDGAEARHQSARVATGPVWLGTADGLDVKLSLGSTAKAIHDVRVHLFNTLGDARPANPIVRGLRAMGRFLSSTPAPSAEAAPVRPAIISRAQWGADPRLMNPPGPGLAPTVKMAFIHHTDTTNSYTKSQSAGIVRGIFRYHTQSRGYFDIAYNFLIDRYGQIFEGRTGGIDKPVIGAHTGGLNYETTGISLIGNFVSANPPSAMISSLQRLLSWKLDVHHVAPVGRVRMIVGVNNPKYARGTPIWLNTISGHRDGSPTSCPGAAAYAKLPGIRTGVTHLGNPKIYWPVAQELLRPDGDNVNESERFSASFSESVSWTLTIRDRVGTAKRTLSGKGTTFVQYWGATSATGAVLPSGLYTWTLTARNAGGYYATPASGALTIVTTHPAGTPLQDAAGRYVVDAGTRKSVDVVAYASYFGTIAPVATGPAERARYTDGGPIALRDGTLLQDPDGKRYIWSASTLRRFSTDPVDTFTALGYKTPLVVSQQVIDSLPTGIPVSDATIHPAGTVVKAPDGSTWMLLAGGARQRMSALAAASRRGAQIVNAVSGDLTAAIAPGAFPVQEGTVIADGGTPWIVTGGSKRRFASASLFWAMGYTAPMELAASASDIAAVPTGSVLG